MSIPEASDRIYPHEFYGDNTRWFIGVVEDVNDPMRLGRVRVRIRGIHSSRTEDISTGDLPWAQTVIPTTEGGVSGLGRNGALAQGAEVFGIFLDGKFSQLPLVMGSIPRVEYQTAVQRSSPSADGRVDYTSPLTLGTGQGGGGPAGQTRNFTPSSTPPGTGTTGERNRIEPRDPSAFGATGGTNAEIAFNFFVEYGFTPQQAAGIVGNLMQESGPALNTSAEAAGSEQSFGIAQWNAASAAGYRFQGLQQFASDLGRDWRDLDVQLQYVVYELETKPYLGLAQLRATQTIEQATLVFQDKYERPGIPHTQSRIRYARDIYSRMVRG